MSKPQRVTKTSRIRGYIFRNPFETNQQIADALGLTPPYVAQITGIPSTLNGQVLCRKPDHLTVSGVTAYQFWYAPPAEAEGFEVKARQKREVVKAPPPAKTTPKQENVLPSPPKLEVPVHSSVTDAIDALVAATVSEFKMKLQAQLAQAVRTALPPPTATPVLEGQYIEAPPEKAEAGVRRPKVLITGLLPSQAGQIAIEFRRVLDIDFVDGDRPAIAASKASGVDAVFNHTSHGSHATEDAIKATGAKLIRVSGGMTSMRRVLREFVDAA